MSKELDQSELSKLHSENPSSYLIPLIMCPKGWRTFVLDEAEKRRLGMIDNSTTSYDILLRFVSKTTGVGLEGIDSLYLTDSYITVVPAIPNVIG